MSLELEVHEALYEALTDPAQTALAALISGRVYDRVPGPQPTYPYLVLSAIEVRDVSNSCGQSWLVSPVVTIWSNAVGRAAEALTIGHLVREILAPAVAPFLTLTGYRVSTWQNPATIYRPGSDPLLTEGIVTLTYIVHPT